jgi:hypothetical protein
MCAPGAAVQVYTWGSGYCGQLGQGSTLVSLRPSIVDHFCELQVSLSSVLASNRAILSRGPGGSAGLLNSSVFVR